jgi:enolase
MDVAASEFYTEDGKYDLDFKTKNNDKSQVLTGEQLANLYTEYVRDYPIVSIEDPFDQEDWESYAKLTEKIGKSIQIVGDDLLVTNPKRIQTGIEKKSCNALLLKVKLNQGKHNHFRSIKLEQLPRAFKLASLLNHKDGV